MADRPLAPSQNQSQILHPSLPLRLKPQPPATATTPAQSIPSEQSISNVFPITDKKSHDEAVDRAHAGTPTIMFVSNPPMPQCAELQPKFEALAQRHADKTFYIVEMTPEITPMIKFGPWQCPILIYLKGEYCETILGGDIKRFEERIKSM